MNAATFEEYRVRHPGDADVRPPTAAEANGLRPAVLDRMATGERSDDPRVEALGLLTYERSGHGTRSYAGSLDEVLAELIVGPSTEAPAEPKAEPPTISAGAADAVAEPSEEE